MDPLESRRLWGLIRADYHQIAARHWVVDDPGKDSNWFRDDLALRRADIWFRSRETGKEVYLFLDESSSNEALAVYNALFSPLAESFQGLWIFRNGEIVEPCEWKSYMSPPFRADNSVPVIDVAGLVLKSRIGSSGGYDLVERNGQAGEFVHKYMKPLSSTHEFEEELNVLQKLDGSAYVLRLVGIVQTSGENRGLLLSDAVGDEFRPWDLSICDKWRVTIHFLKLLLDFDSRGYFPTNLGPWGFIIRPDNSLAMTDLHPSTYHRLFYRPKPRVIHPDGQEFRVGPNPGTFSGSSSFYSIGRKVQHTWTALAPREGAEVEIPMEVPIVIQNLIEECVVEGCRFETVKDFVDAYVPRIEEEMVGRTE